MARARSPRPRTPARGRTRARGSSATRPTAPFVEQGVSLTPDRLAAVVRRVELGDLVYQLERVRCSSHGCWCHVGSRGRKPYPEGGHGPYWYVYWLNPRTQRWRATYIGKDFRELLAPPNVFGPVRPAP